MQFIDQQVDEGAAPALFSFATFDITLPGRHEIALCGVHDCPVAAYNCKLAPSIMRINVAAFSGRPGKDGSLMVGL